MEKYFFVFNYNENNNICQVHMNDYHSIKA